MSEQQIADDKYSHFIQTVNYTATLLHCTINTNSRENYNRF